MEIKGEGWAGVLRVTDLKPLIFSSLAENISRYLVFLDCTVLKSLSSILSRPNRLHVYSYQCVRAPRAGIY